MAFTGTLESAAPKLSFAEKVWNINWGLILLLTAVSCFGFAMLYSAANGSLSPWAGKQMIRFAGSVAMMIVVSMIDIRFWRKTAYPLYVIAFVLLVLVELHGRVGMGAQRWIEIGPIQIQPSEVMKIAIVLVLARYFHGLSMEEVARPLPLRLIPPVLLALAPAALVMKQPDLGTAMMLLFTTSGMLFVAGVRLWKFATVAAVVAAVVPYAWNHMRDYQKNRILTFLDPENDPLGTGYHILQSKIAFGSGGVFGKGFMMGTQAQLNFLPEKQTDFIFTMLAEELGLAGCLAVLALYTLIFVYGYAIALRSRSHFGRLLALGITINFFFYVFINTAMVMGLLPVVGIPLPLVSYGGTAMLTVMFGFGLLMSVYIHRDVRLGRRGENLD